MNIIDEMLFIFPRLFSLNLRKKSTESETVDLWMLPWGSGWSPMIMVRELCYHRAGSKSGNAFKEGLNRQLFPIAWEEDTSFSSFHKLQS